MSGTQMSKEPVSQEQARQVPMAATSDLKLEVVILPVADVERSKRFYESLGWRLDADFSNGDWRAMQMTPPGSPCSIIFGRGVTTAAPGSVQGNFLIVDDVEVARAELKEKGVDISEVFHFDGVAPGSYRLYAFEDVPDGAWEDDAFLNEVEGDGTKMDLSEREVKAIEVPLLTKSKLAATLRKLGME